MPRRRKRKRRVSCFPNALKPMKNDQTIRVLPDNIANQIAAGEVVERPASVLKELIENSMDSGASQVDCELVAGGRTLIRVSDNGVGMSRDDALLSVERFATSKIRALAELERIGTLGFRGEALAAISSVSRFTLLTRRQEDLAGTEISMSAGKLLSVRDQGCAPGTSISVRNLFFNIPARRKFLRSQQTELFHAKQAFMLYALSRPEAAMIFKVDGREIINLPGNASLEQRLGELYPSSYRGALKRIAASDSVVRVTGYASLPTIVRSDRNEQYYFVNGRPAAAAVLGSAAREAYRGMLPKDKYPLIFLFVSVDPALVDVNVHPTKREVRFRNPSSVRDAVIDSIRRALSFPGQAPISIYPAPQDHGIPARAGAPDSAQVEPEWDLFRAQLKEQPVQPARHPQTGFHAAPWSNFRVLGQISGLYVVMETDAGLVLMDPHAAHERVLFEQLMARATAGKALSHRLLLPETVELSPKDAQLLRTHAAALDRMGFGLAEFGGDSFVVDAMPACLSGMAPGALLTDLVASLAQTGAEARLLIEERIAQAACKAAVKARNLLTDSEIESLIRQLSEAEMPYTCPHGRPTLIHISKEELDRRFGRA